MKQNKTDATFFACFGRPRRLGATDGGGGTRNVRTSRTLQKKRIGASSSHRRRDRAVSSTSLRACDASAQRLMRPAAVGEVTDQPHPRFQSRETTACRTRATGHTGQPLAHRAREAFDASSREGQARSIVPWAMRRITSTTGLWAVFADFRTTHDLRPRLQRAASPFSPALPLLAEGAPGPARRRQPPPR